MCGVWLLHFLWAHAHNRELRVLEEGASKLKKDGLRDLLVCVGIFQAFDV